MSPLGDSTIGTVTGWLKGLGRRQEAISSNIANIDTPGYKRQDVAFESELRRQAGRGATGLATTDSRHISSGSKLRNQLGLDPAQMLTSSRMDGNNVDIDQEMIALADTQMRYQAASSALSSKLRTIRNVIQG
ncbi:MAG: flagellar basal body rod protein FlgB [Anaerolinea sp.]|nr:flagellar basal body rod protein FlgB [Anaerolinea sp.]